MFRAIALTDWESYRNVAAQLEDHLFRGVENATWYLRTSLEREAPYASVDGTWGHLSTYESNTLQDFKRRAHHYGQLALDVPWVEVSALLRHHGGPSRLLDVSRSPYVAAYFAIEGHRARPSSDNPNGNLLSAPTPAVWAFSVPRLHNAANAALGGVNTLQDVLRRAFAELESVPNTQRFVFNGEPFRINERMAVQKGTFLIPFSSTALFEESLVAPFGAVPNDLHVPATPYAGEDLSQIAILRLELSRSLVEEAMIELDQMNITAASLYPGLDGFARSLAVRLRHDLPHTLYSIAPAAKL